MILAGKPPKKPSTTAENRNDKFRWETQAEWIRRVLLDHISALKKNCTQDYNKTTTPTQYKDLENFVETGCSPVIQQPRDLRLQALDNSIHGMSYCLSLQRLFWRHTDRGTGQFGQKKRRRHSCADVPPGRWTGNQTTWLISKN